MVNLAKAKNGSRDTRGLMEGPNDPYLLCRACAAVKLRKEFYVSQNRASGAAAWCKPCTRARQVEYENQLDPAIKQERYRRRNLRSRFNMTLEEFKAVLAEQGGRCAGCSRAQDELKSPLAVDHDHSTRLIRGILCFSCNSMLPVRRNIRELFHALTNYLDDPPAQRILGERRANTVRRRSRRPFQHTTEVELNGD